jgi:hypothetical protein
MNKCSFQPSSETHKQVTATHKQTAKGALTFESYLFLYAQRAVLEIAATSSLEASIMGKDNVLSQLCQEYTPRNALS